MAGVKCLHYGVLNQLQQQQHDQWVYIVTRQMLTPGENVMLYDDANLLQCEGLVMELSGIDPVVHIICLKRETLQPWRPTENNGAPG